MLDAVATGEHTEPDCAVVWAWPSGSESGVFLRKERYWILDALVSLSVVCRVVSSVVHLPNKLGSTSDHPRAGGAHQSARSCCTAACIASGAYEVHNNIN